MVMMMMMMMKLVLMLMLTTLNRIAAFYRTYCYRYTSYLDRYTSIHLHCMQVQDLHTTPVSAITAQTYMEQELGRRLRMKRCTP